MLQHPREEISDGVKSALLGVGLCRVEGEDANRTGSSEQQSTLQRSILCLGINQLFENGQSRGRVGGWGRCDATPIARRSIRICNSWSQNECPINLALRT